MLHQELSLSSKNPTLTNMVLNLKKKKKRYLLNL